MAVAMGADVCAEANPMTKNESEIIRCGKEFPHEAFTNLPPVKCTRVLGHPGDCAGVDSNNRVSVTWRADWYHAKFYVGQYEN